MSLLLTLFPAVNEASFEGALFGLSQHFPADVDLEWKESAEQHEFHPRGPVDAPSEDFLPHGTCRQVHSPRGSVLMCATVRTLCLLVSSVRHLERCTRSHP